MARTRKGGAVMVSELPGAQSHFRVMRVRFPSSPFMEASHNGIAPDSRSGDRKVIGVQFLSLPFLAGCCNGIRADC